MEVSGRLHFPAALPPEKELQEPIGQEAGWAPESVWTRSRKENFPIPAGNRTSIVQPVVIPYTDWATPAHIESLTGIM
jgi:hypothetical protein